MDLTETQPQRTLEVPRLGTTQPRTDIERWLIGTEAVPGLLKQRNMSVEDLARSMGSANKRTSLYNYFSGLQIPTEVTLQSICVALEIPYEQGLKHVTPARSTGRRRKSDKIDNPLEQLEVK